MATVAKTITINAAFLKEIKDDSQDLRELLHDAHELFAISHPHVTRQHVVDLLAELRDRLALHFALEEAYGYFEDAIAAEPQLCERAESLRSEHRTLFLELCELEDHAEARLYHEAAPCRLAEIACGFHAFHDRLVDHETRENDLILASLGTSLDDDD